MKKTSQRAARVADQIQREIVQILREQVKDPRVGPITVTAVEVSPDLSHAKIYFSQLAGREHAKEAVEALQHAAGYVRRELSHRLRLRLGVAHLLPVHRDPLGTGDEEDEERGRDPGELAHAPSYSAGRRRETSPERERQPPPLPDPLPADAGRGRSVGPLPSPLTRAREVGRRRLST